VIYCNHDVLEEKVAPTAISISQLAALINGESFGEEVTITGVNTVHEANNGDIAFVDNLELLPVGEQSDAAALIVSPRARTEAKPIIVTEDPRLAFSRVLEIFAPERRVYPGVHPTAVLGSNVTIEEGVSIGAHTVVGDNVTISQGSILHPLVYVGHDASIGSQVEIFPQVYVGERVSIGNRCIIHAGAVIGSDGFGFLQQPNGHKKIPQIGCVIIEDDVEIGANSTVDRATISATIIGSGTKIDDSVHIAHNCVIGRNCLFAGQVGIAGSTRIGDNVIMGGQAGVNDHVQVCDNVMVGAQAGIFSDIDEPGIYSGYPARSHRLQMRVLAGTQRLPELLRKVRELEERLAALESPDNA
jgi:UDP-3-O-[3-hydroxymyristoyl] glucosamine N-acyltransferase